MLTKRIPAITNVESIPFMNELSMIVRTPVTTKAIPPARFDSYHAKSLLSVHDVLTPINEFLFVFGRKFPAIINSKAITVFIMNGTLSVKVVLSGFEIARIRNIN